MTLYFTVPLPDIDGHGWICLRKQPSFISRNVKWHHYNSPIYHIYSYIIYKDHIDIHIYLAMPFPNVFLHVFFVKIISLGSQVGSKKNLRRRRARPAIQRLRVVQPKSPECFFHAGRRLASWLTDRLKKPNKKNAAFKKKSCVWIPIICVYCIYIYIYVSIVD